MGKQRNFERTEYAADFFVGDVRNVNAFNVLKEKGYDSFDVISIQFALSYLAESEHVMRALLSQLVSLLRPGGRIIGSAPASDALAKVASSKFPHAAQTNKSQPLG